MLYSISYIFLFFMIYSFIGWLMEVLLTFYNEHKFVDRGFLIGPYCPIYGYGVLLITKLLIGYTDNALVLFILAMAICMVLEYITSFFMEKLFKARWWDYSNKKFNINGRVCLETTIPFGLGGLLIMYLVNPFIFELLDSIPKVITIILSIVLFFIFLIDNIVSLMVISKVKKADIRPNKDNTEEITKKIRQYLKDYSILTRRLSEAFPNFKYTIKLTKEKVEDLREKSKEIRKEMVLELKEKQKEIKREIKKIKKEKKNK